MEESTIRCPKCKTAIKLTDAVAAPLLESARAQFEQDLVTARQQIAEEERAKANTEASKIISKDLEALRAVAERATADAKELRENFAKQEAKLTEAQQEQARLLAKEHALDEAQRELDLTVAKRVNAEAIIIRMQAQHTAEDAFTLKVAEKEEQIASMTRQIDELKRRAEQGSQQLQGEAQELFLEQLLQARFPTDTIEPVAKGAFGGDVLQRVIAGGQVVGTILWESKRTKNWSDSWLAKLRDDQRNAKAEIALLVTQAMPKLDGRSVQAFDLIDGVWVAEWRCAMPMAVALRQSLIDLAMARSVSKGQRSKMELMYSYLTGPQFKLRVGAIVEKFSDMASDLAQERKTMTRLWAKREAQIQGALDASAGMYGDLQGIAGRNMLEIDGLTVKELKG